MNTQFVTAIVTIVAGVTTSVISHLVSKKLELRFFSIKSEGSKADAGVGRRWIFLPAVIGGIVGLLVGYYVISIIILCPPFSAKKLEITSPVPGSSVYVLTPVQGKACNVSKNEKIWLLVLPDKITAYYPQPGTIIVSADGQWSSSAYVGLNDRKDVGRGFTLLAVLADSQGDSDLQNYMKQASSDAGQKGLPLLPSGVRILHQVRVIRQ